METVKPLTLYEFSPQRGTPGHCHAAQVFKNGKAFLMIEPTEAEQEATDAAKRIADFLNQEDVSSRVRALEETNAKLSGIVTHFEHEMELTKSLLEASEQENKRLQERLEAAEKYLDWNISSILHSDSSRELQIRLEILQKLKQKYSSLKP